MPNRMNAGATIGLVQMRCTGSREENLHRALKGIGEAAEKGAQIVCLPELFSSLYFCQKQDPALFDLAEPIPGHSSELLAQAAKKHQVVLISSVFEKRAPGLYHNTALVHGPDGSLLGMYRKMHIPDDPLFYEKYYFTPGDLGFKAIDTPFGKIGVLVCWDQWYPEAARLTALQGAQILFYPTAIGWHPAEREEFGNDQLTAWQLAQRAHALASGVFVAGVNRFGHEGDPNGGLTFWGHTFVSDPYARLLDDAPHDRDACIIRHCDFGLIEETRRHWPFLRDRRIDAYGGITNRFGTP